MASAMAASSGYYDAAVVSSVQSIIDHSTKAPITKWKDILEILNEHKIVYTFKATAAMMLVHPANRSKLGVNPYNCHRVGAYIKRMGADLELLNKATAIEIAPLDPKHSDQLEFNRKLVAMSSEMLAPINGSERFLSLGNGHTAQFAKAAGAQCRTPQASMSTDGYLNVQHLTKDDHSLKIMLEEGWTWTILPWQAEEVWPALPDLVQRSLNASNSIASQASELETACAVAEFAQMQANAGGTVDWEKAIEAACASMPPCANYIQTIGAYVKLYSGGGHAPMIHYLDEFAKAFGENRRLGEEFLQAVTEAKFGSASKLYPHIRTGLLAANLVSPKIVDGLARLLVKSDVERLKAKANAAAVDFAENSLAEGWTEAMRLVDDKHVTLEKAYQALGRFHSRTILRLTGKAKLGFEKKEFKTQDDIQRAFIEDLSKFAPAGIAVCTMWASNASQAKPGEPTTQSSNQPAEQGVAKMSDLTDPSWVARNAGFIVGKIYYERSVGSAKGVYELKKLTSNEVTLNERTLYRDPRVVNYDVDKFMQQWVEFKGELPAALTTSPKHMFSTSGHYKLEREKIKVFTILLDFAQENQERINSLSFSLYPAEVVANEPIGKNKLELTPATELKNISANKTPGAVIVTTKSATFYVSEPPRPRTIKEQDWRDDVVFAAFWWVGTTHNEADANMVATKYVHKDGVTFYKLTNSKQIKKYERLVVFKPKKEVMPLSDASGPAKRSRKG